MSTPELQDLTSSEPLSLAEEYEMRSKWENDSDKLTFIILRRDLYESCQAEASKKELESMIGDVNLFLNESETIGDVCVETGELEIMIADKANRGLGFGSEALGLLINYCLKHLTHISTYVAKINENNSSSINMFEKKFGFQQYDHIRVFKQVCLKLEIDQSVRDFFEEKFKLSHVVENYF
jgi:RimJ/RimL family protein N-acetyltransferase